MRKFSIFTDLTANKRIKFAHCVRPTRNGEAPLLAAYARRYA
jgi:hypothetical protein